MGRPSKEPDEKRTERYNLRFTLAEMEYVRSQADAAGLTVMDYIRRRSLDYNVPPGGGLRRADPALVSELNRIGVNVNQLALATHTGRDFVRYWQAIGEELTRVLERVVEAQLDPEDDAR